jgi:hypothetical protein
VRRDSVGRVLDSGVSHGKDVECAVFDGYVVMEVERLLGGGSGESVSCGWCLSRC